jgi:DNA-binding FadR family transcriptional regulator
MEFHNSLREAVANPFMRRISESLYVLGTEYRKVKWESPGMLAQSVLDHEAIVKALVSRDPDAVGRAMVGHMTSVHHSTLEVMDRL